MIRLKYQYNEVYLLCWWNDAENYGGIVSFEDEYLLKRAFRSVYDNKTFESKDEFVAYVKKLKKKAIIALLKRGI